MSHTWVSFPERAWAKFWCRRIAVDDSSRLGYLLIGVKDNLISQFGFEPPKITVVQDGSGYPAGLQGEEFLLEARILAVADAVEAMVSHRPYRPGLGTEKALEELSQNRGVLYDPEAVDACLCLFTENRFSFTSVASSTDAR
jgi:hypothetical protein